MGSTSSRKTILTFRSDHSLCVPMAGRDGQKARHLQDREMLPPRIPKKTNRSDRWKSQRHCNYIRSHACCGCGSMAAIEVAHVRLGSGAGMGRKPDDHRAVSLCRDCHQKQHTIGEATFWKQVGQDVEILIDAFCRTSPVAREIKEARSAE